MSESSVMRTIPASTIGEIGAAAGFAAIAIARGESLLSDVCAAKPLTGAGISDMAKSLVRDATPTARLKAAARTLKFLRNVRQERLIATMQIVRTWGCAALLPRVRRHIRRARRRPWPRC